MVATPRPGRAASAALLLSAVLALSCGAGGGNHRAPSTPVTPANGVITIRAFEWGFEPDAIALEAGEQVRIDLQNDGEVLHDLKIAGLQGDIVDIENNGPLSGDEGELLISADSGEGSSITFVPREAGTFTFYCTVRGHQDLGMEGDLTVR